MHRALQGKEATERFARERQILASLRHDHLCRLYDGGLTDDRRPYVVLEFVAGRTLIEHCEQNKLNSIERIRLFRQALEGIAHAHAEGIIHRDLKPSNLLVQRGVSAEPDPAQGAQEVGDAPVASAKDRLVVVDFGIARPAAGSDLTRTGLALGTPGYLAPEVMRSATVSVATDVFALGAVLFELLTG
ncbi:MAG: serine/threonine-protein kinase, partial [Pseudomonadota bacterium]